MGFEPMNTGFADQRVSHFAIGAHRLREDPQTANLLRTTLPQCSSQAGYLAAVASSFFARYQVETLSPAPPPLVRRTASAVVAGAGTITG